MKKGIILLLAVIIMATCTCCGGNEPDYMDSLAIQQVDPRWASYVPEGFSESMGGLSCGIFAMVNAVRYLTGTVLDPIELADKFAAAKAFTEEGTWRFIAFVKDGPAEQYLKENNIPVVFEEYWNETADFDLIDKYLAEGCAIEFHAPGHFMAIVAKDEETGKYLILDSAVVNTKRYLSVGGSWLTLEQLTRDGSAFRLNGFCAYKCTGKTVVHNDLPATDNSELYRYSVLATDGTEKQGTVKFVGSNAKMYYAKVGETLKVQVTPKLGYKCIGLDVGGSFIQPLNDGKKAVYEIEQQDGFPNIQVYFTSK